MTEIPTDGEQLALLAPVVPRQRPRPGPAAAASEQPVARVLVDTGLAHLDRPFEYLVPAVMAEDANPGARVKVRFAGQDLDGLIIDRTDTADHEGRLAPLRRVVSSEPVLTPRVLAAAEQVAASHAGSVLDVLRLAVPKRHAAAERALPLTAPPSSALTEPQSDPPGPGPWSRYAAGEALLRRLTAGEAPVVSWLAAPAGGHPADDWPAAIAHAVAATLLGGRGSIVVLPDHRDVTRVEKAVEAVLGRGRHVRLTADQGPQARYTAFLKVLRGHVPVVIGTRAAAWAPLPDLGLLLCWDDGDDLHDEPRAPYAHTRDVVLTRARIEGAAALIGGFALSTATARLVDERQVAPVGATRATVRAGAPAVRLAHEGRGEVDPVAARAHLPPVAWQAAKQALTRGPVLVQVPRRGYLPALACGDCRAAARCRQCAGPLGLTGRGESPHCGWCGRPEPDFCCPSCDGRRVRSTVIGARRTADELGRAFPGVKVQTSGAGEVLDTVPDSPRLVIATPGAEPVAPAGYAAALLLDAWALLDRPVLSAAEEAVRRWFGAAALVRPASEGGVVVLAGAPAHTSIPAVEALVRWDPVWFAGRELGERRELQLPPTVAMGVLAGPRAAVSDALARADLGGFATVLGPMPDGEGEGARALVRAPLAAADRLAAALRALRRVRSAHKLPDAVTVRLNPRDP